MQQVLGCSVSYRIAVGPQQGRKVFTLQTIPAWEDDDRFSQVAKASGFSLHAGVAAQAWERSKLERLCRYISRPAVSEKRLSLTPSGNIRYDVKGFTSVAGAWMRRSDSAQNALQRWHHACHLRTAGFYVAHPCAPPFGRLLSCKLAFLPICHCQAGGAGPETESESDKVSRCFCTQQKTPC
jgi:hypothetical protein